MNNFASTSKQNVAVYEEDEIFEDSSIMANFNNSSFKETTAKPGESNINDSLNKSELNVSALCCDEEISGYDKLTGRTWIYPTNFPVRDYQYNIINASILKNTLVSLPTGLGKTFIAAVIMYNFYRWYPLGKIVFMAPTRPLVAQQIDACYNIVAIPPSDTVEMTGHMQANTRKTHWQSKRVFFATPQVIYNDIKSGICPGDKIRCLVVDEAHRARGNYAYCLIVAALTDMGHKTYRVLALSATPGSKVEDVVNVVKNLHIAHLELRTESCIDVAPYSHARSINIVLIQLGPELTQLRQRYVEILDKYARSLKELNILPHNLGNLSKGRIVMLYKEFQNKDRANRHARHAYIMKDFTVLIALFHGLELLTRHGSRVFLNFFDEHPEKSWIQADDALTALLERLRDDLGVNPLALNRSILPDGTIPELPQTLCFGHPKFIKLKEIMMDHFNRAKDNKLDTRAIVFCEYRESVNLVHCMLLQCRPLITPQMFVGQGASGKDGKTMVSQKQQLRVMRCFREGSCNALVATCVAEEGLDVGSVDLILCFDVATRSPVRLVQRCGRTGRERGGQVHILVTEGREHQTLMDCMRQRDGLNKKVLQSREVQAGLYAANPRMLPRGLTPRCHKMYLTVAKRAANDKGTDADKANKKSQKDLRTMLLGRAASSSSSGSSSKDFETNLITEEEFKETFPEGYRSTNLLMEHKEYWSMSKETLKSISNTEEADKLKLSTWLEWQRTLQKTINIGHSRDTEIMATLLQYSDAKRFDMPASTQNPCFNTQDLATQNIIIPPPVILSSPAKTKQSKKKPKVPLIKSPTKKDGDIRALFSTATKSTKNYTKFISDLGIQNDGSIPTRLIDLLVDLSLDNTNTARTCYICQNICDCTLIKNLRKTKKPSMPLNFIKEPKFPDIDLIDDIDAETILKCVKNADESDDLANKCDENMSYLDVDNKNNYSGNFDLEFDFDSPIDLTSPKEVERGGTLNKNDEKHFDIGDIEDIFHDSSPDEAIPEVVDVKDINSSDPKNVLGFFGLDSIDDIFADSNDSIGNKSSETPNVVKSKEDSIKVRATSTDNKPVIPKRPGSPSILSGRQQTNIPKSPILCSQVRKFKLSTKKKQPQSSTPNSNTRIPEPYKNNNIVMKPKEKVQTNKSIIQNSLADTSNKSLFTITQLVDMINQSDNEKSTFSKCSSSKRISNQNNIVEDERSTSPILLTQADRNRTLNHVKFSKSKNISTTKSNTPVSLIILESDSDSENDTQVYDADEKFCEITSNQVNITKPLSTPEKSSNFETLNNYNEPITTEPFKSPVTAKRKLEIEDTINDSPYFNKKKKLNNNSSKTLTLQEKVLAALTSSKMNKDTFNNDTNINCVLSPCFKVLNKQSSPKKIVSQKENQNPQNNSDDEKEYVRKRNLEMLQMFRRDSPKLNLELFMNSQAKTEILPRIPFDDSDDDFINDNTDHRQQNPANEKHRKRTATNHKVRKKKSKGKEFLELEAELSAGECDSGDELSDDSVGSIVDFICDDNITHHEGMQAHYMRSVKSPVNGIFKIPQLPSKHNNADVFSQYVEEDNYEMDSFCVGATVGLTQVNDDSELELAEIILESRKKKKKRPRSQSPRDNDGSPLVRRKIKNVKRRISSDSEDSS